jgi:hypothetical protein
MLYLLGVGVGFFFLLLSPKVIENNLDSFDLKDGGKNPTLQFSIRKIGNICRQTTNCSCQTHNRIFILLKKTFGCGELKSILRSTKR